MKDGPPTGEMYTFDSSELATLEIHMGNATKYGDSLVKARTAQVKKIGRYDPYLYFRDLKQLSMFEVVCHDSLNATTEGRIIFLHCLSYAGGTKGNLVMLRDNYPCNQSFDLSGRTLPSGMSIQEARHYWFPAEAARALARAQQPPTKLKEDIMIPIGRWLLGIYLKGLPIAFLLFILWRMQLQKDYEEHTWQHEPAPKLRLVPGMAPLSFLFALIMWPLILYRDIRNRAKEMLRKAELISRRSELLYFFSKGDEQLLAAGSKMSLREFRAYLESIGKVRRHSFVIAIAITLAVSLSPSAPFYPTMGVTVATTAAMMSVHGSSDHDVGRHKAYTVIKHYIEVVIVETPKIAPSVNPRSYFFFLTIGQVLQGFLQRMRGVPKASNYFRMKLIA